MALNIYYYEHLHLPDGWVSMTLLVWILYAGILIGSIVGTLDKHYCAAFVAALVQQGADGAEKAITLHDLEVRGKWYLKGALKPGRALRKMVEVAGEAPRSVQDTAFYLPEEKRARAELRYENGKTPIRTLILAAILLTAVAVGAQFVLPELLQLLDNLLGSL